MHLNIVYQVKKNLYNIKNFQKMIIGFYFILLVKIVFFTTFVSILSFYRCILINLLIGICLLIIFTEKVYKINVLLFNLFILWALLYCVFITNNIFLFYLGFERSLLPLLFIIWRESSSVKKLLAGWYLLFFTFFGSLFFLFALLLIYTNFGTFNYDVLHTYFLDVSFLNIKKIIWWCFFIAFRVKIPLVPFHMWLLEAHVEAPTYGSILLAGIILKLGGFGILKYNVFLIPELTQIYRPYCFRFISVGIFYAAIITRRQVDLKRLIAYSSIAHIGVIIIGLLTCTTYGVSGGIFLIIAHGVISSALFFLVGCLYKRFKSRLINNYTGVRIVIPLWSFFFFLFLISNFRFPLTRNFSGEFLVRLGLGQKNLILMYIVIIITIFTLFYSIIRFSSICLGTIKIVFKHYLDLTRFEFLVLSLLSFWNIILGCFPNCILQNLERIIFYIL